MELWTLTVVVVVFIIGLSGCQSQSSEERILKKSQVLKQIFENYEKTDLPPTLSTVNNNGTEQPEPVPVLVGLGLLKIEDLDDVLFQFSVEALFVQQWDDPRLKFDHLRRDKRIQDHILIQGNSNYKLWSPGIFFNNEKSGFLHSLTEPNTETKIHSNGTVMETARLTLSLSCKMDLHSFPMDTQDCPVNLETFSWTMEDVTLKWKTTNVQFDPSIFTSSKFNLRDIYKVKCVPTSAEYNCLSLHVKFERELGFYLVRIYIPCIMLIILSWVPFWLEPVAVEARLSLSVTIILAMVTQVYGINQSSPPTTYIKAIDVWTGFCQLMAFSSLMKIAATSYFHRNRNHIKQKQDVESPGHQVEELFKSVTARKVDSRARLIFPMIFLLFNLAYWGKYLNK